MPGSGDRRRPRPHGGAGVPGVWRAVKASCSNSARCHLRGARRQDIRCVGLGRAQCALAVVCRTGRRRARKSALKRPWTADYSRAAYPERRHATVLSSTWRSPGLGRVVPGAGARALPRCAGYVATTIVLFGAVLSIFGPKAAIRFALKRWSRRARRTTGRPDLRRPAGRLRRGDRRRRHRRAHRGRPARRRRPSRRRVRPARAGRRLLPSLSAQGAPRRQARASIASTPARTTSPASGKAGRCSAF